MDDNVTKNTVSVLVDNEPGVLARVIGLISGRGYNIDSLTVAEVDAEKHISRITNQYGESLSEVTTKSM